MTIWHFSAFSVGAARRRWKFGFRVLFFAHFEFDFKGDHVLSTHLLLPTLRSRLFPATALALLAVAGSSQAQVVIAGPPKIGSSNPVTAEPLVTRPATKPCVVALFTNQEFADYSAKTFSYTPPADCPGPWAKVVFTADFTVTAGVQFDRTAALYLGHANIYFGTTSEPGATLSPSWHVERDVTDLSALFNSSQSGEADIYNIVNSTYTGIIYANAALEFYPASSKFPAAESPDIVVPFPDAPGGAVQLVSTSSQLSQSVTLPKNVERAYLDVISQSQQGDEFWYTCVPNDVTGPLQSCGITGFRETEISIDGKPAGVAPVSPWIFTGGIDPLLWSPITGVQTLDFKPYRVDLTPFAALLSDGSPHTVALSVFNANNYFQVTANLLAYTDHGASVVTGGMLSDTLTNAPSPKVVEDLNLDSSGHGTATVKVASTRIFTISGYVITSHGKVTTIVGQNVNFVNLQKFTLTGSTYDQNITQVSTVDSQTTTEDSKGTRVLNGQNSFPLNMDISLLFNSDGSYSQTTTSDQVNLLDLSDGTKPLSYAKEEVKSQDTLYVNSSNEITGNSGASSSATDEQFNDKGEYYSLGLTAKGNVLTAIGHQPCD
jgi:hypothetical protein